MFLIVARYTDELWKMRHSAHRNTYQVLLEYYLKRSKFQEDAFPRRTQRTISYPASIQYLGFKPQALYTFSAINCNLDFETHAVSQTKYCSGLVRDTQNTLCICIDANFSSNVNCKVS